MLNNSARLKCRFLECTSGWGSPAALSDEGTASSQGAVYKAVRSQPVVAQAGTRLAQMHISSGPRICPSGSLLLAACALVHTGTSTPTLHFISGVVNVL